MINTQEPSGKPGQAPLPVNYSDGISIARRSSAETGLRTGDEGSLVEEHS